MPRPVNPFCLDCGVEKTPENTYRAQSGLQSRCKTCFAAYLKARRCLYKKPARPRPVSDRCPHCGQIKTVKNTGIRANGGFESWCRRCSNPVSRDVLGHSNFTEVKQLADSITIKNKKEKPQCLIKKM